MGPKKLVWLSDVHCNFLKPTGLAYFLDEVAGHGPDAVLIGGDIAEAPSLLFYLRRIAERLGVPVYFVLGNHDYYRGSIAEVEREVNEACEISVHLRHLPEEGVVSLSDTVALVGHGCIGDARAGDWESTEVELSDFDLIRELRGLSREKRVPVLRSHGDRAARHLARVLPEALKTHQLVIVLTHVPPWKDACWYEGKTSSPDFLPYFTCQAAGEAIIDAARKFPDRRVLCLCGHTHSPGQARILPNLQAVTASTEYYHPAVEMVLEY